MTKKPHYPTSLNYKMDYQKRFFHYKKLTTTFNKKVALETRIRLRDRLQFVGRTIHLATFNFKTQHTKICY